MRHSVFVYKEGCHGVAVPYLLRPDPTLPAQFKHLVYYTQPVTIRVARDMRVSCGADRLDP